MGLNAREKHTHSIGPIVQEGNLHTIHVVCQFIDICLQLSKSWGKVEWNELSKRQGSPSALTYCGTVPALGTFFALQGHTRLQVVHL